MKFWPPLRWVALMLILAAPALLYLGIWYARQSGRQAAVRRARAERQAWAQAILEKGAARQGLEIGKPFPRLPIVPAHAPEQAIVPSRQTIVMLTHRIPGVGETQNQIKALLDRAPSFNLLVITNEEPEAFALNVQALRHPRLSYGRMEFTAFDKLQIIQPGAYYRLDSVGIVRQASLFDDKTRLDTLRSFLGIRS